MVVGGGADVDASPFPDVGGMGSESRRMSETPFLYVKDFLDRTKSQMCHTKSENRTYLAIPSRIDGSAWLSTGAAIGHSYS